MRWHGPPSMGIHIGWQPTHPGVVLPHIRGHEHVGQLAFALSPVFNTRAVNTANTWRPWRYRQGQAMMGVRGMMGYVLKNFHGGAPRERLGKVMMPHHGLLRSRWATVILQSI